MASNTYQSFLMVGEDETGETTTWKKLIDIKDYPDIMGAPAMLATTTMSDPAVTEIPGIREGGVKDFTANYPDSEEVFVELEGLENQVKKYAIFFGADDTGEPDGHLGKFQCEGRLNYQVVGKGVNDVREIRLSIAQSKAFERVVG